MRGAIADSSWRREIEARSALCPKASSVIGSEVFFARVRIPTVKGERHRQGPSVWTHNQ